MKRLLFSLILAILLPLFAMAQSVPVSFTGRDANNRWVQLDRVVITDQTKGWSETIAWPDTTLTMQNGTGIDDYANNGNIGLSQNNPNPFNGTTDVLLTVADAGAVTLEITDVNGRVVVPATDISTIVRANNHSPQHQFRITLSAAGAYIMTARQNGKTASIKMMNNGGGNGDAIEYAGTVRANNYSPRQSRGNTANPFNIGDQMEYIGYATINGEECESQHVTQVQETEETIVLQFREAQNEDDPFSYSMEDTVFIICSMACDFECTSLPFDVTDFEADAAITQASDILGVRVKVEHSFIGDISITLICPNSRSVQLMPDHSHDVGGVHPTYFGIENNTDEDFSYCDPTPNPPGTGWNYCWSEDTVYAQNNGYCFLSANIGHDRERTVDSSHLAIGHPGEDNFVQGQQYYMPYQPFSNLVGCPLNGLWEIQICDEVGMDNGYVFAWEIIFSPNLSGGPSIDLERACPGTPILTDVDGNVYKTLQLGNQCWMRENLRTTRYADSTLIPLSTSTSLSSTTEPYRFVPNGRASNIHTYGFLYNWAAVMHGEPASASNPSNVQGICPTGWHVPSSAEWSELLSYVGSQSEYLCDNNSTNIAKSLASTMGWKTSTTDCAIGNNQNENNATGFSAYPAGTHSFSYDGFGGRTNYWSSTEYQNNTLNAFDILLDSGWCYVMEENSYAACVGKGNSESVRCLKD